MGNHPTTQAVLAEPADLLPTTAKALMRALAGDQNTLTQLFQKPVQVNVEDLLQLVKGVSQKLQRHGIKGQDVRFSAVVTFEKDRSIRLEGADALIKFDWSRSERTRAISVEWEFFCAIEGIHDAEPYRLYVRITESMNPAQLMHAMFSKDAEEVDRIEIDMANVICQVRYRDQMFSTELVNQVSDWHEALRRPGISFDLAGRVLKHRSLVTISLRVLLELAVPLGLIAIFVMSTQQEPVGILTNQVASLYAACILSFLLFVSVSRSTSRWLDASLDRSLARLLRLPVLELTRGDQNRLTEAIAKKQRHLITIAVKIFGVLAIEIIAAIVVALAVT